MGEELFEGAGKVTLDEVKHDDSVCSLQFAVCSRRARAERARRI
jgi:hypothetical protein